MRTSLLMNTGFVIGTGDVSESALGWCTYNGDHMSMYNPNSSIPKTLVKFLVEWAARNEFDGEARRTLLDIVDTLISPELLPLGADGQIAQATESTIGPYELHDFFLFHFLRYGAPPEKILFLAEHARFDRAYTPDELRRWLQRLLAPLLRQPVQALVPAGRPQGRLDQPVAARRLAHAQRRRRRTLVEHLGEWQSVNSLFFGVCTGRVGGMASNESITAVRDGTPGEQLEGFAVLQLGAVGELPGTIDRRQFAILLGEQRRGGQHNHDRADPKRTDGSITPIPSRRTRRGRKHRLAACAGGNNAAAGAFFLARTTGSIKRRLFCQRSSGAGSAGGIVDEGVRNVL